MPSTDVDLPALQAELRVLRDRAEIAELCDRYAMYLDRSRDDDSWFDSVFTDDVQLMFPMGTYKGMAGLAEFHAMARTTFERTHHLSANHTIRLDGDEATVWAHLTAIHLPRRDDPATHFMIGGHYQAAVLRTPRGWRIDRFDFDLVWRGGAGPELPAGH
jgi:hypothetical protein